MLRLAIKRALSFVLLEQRRRLMAFKTLLNVLSNENSKIKNGLSWKADF